MKFEDLGLSDEILSGISALGFDQPTPIQEKAIPMLLGGVNDLVALAQTGTGKTAAFGLPLLEAIDPNGNYPQALVLSPTRELCNQIADDFVAFSKFKKGVKVLSVYGGANIDQQIRQLKKGVNVVVATPGRLVDLIKRKKVDFSKIETVVLDEADEMLNMGFKDDLDMILQRTPETKTTWLFSATMAKDVERIAMNYMLDPEKITVGTKNEGAKNIDHKCYVVSPRDRYQALKRIVDCYPEIFGLIFCRTKRDTQDIADRLMAEGYNVDALHGDLSQNQRDRVMSKFRERKIQLLCATDVAARGIDVNDITHVINYELPDEVESYTHRSGRTARAGKQGESIVIITPRDKFKLKKIEQIMKNKFKMGEIPSGDVVCEAQLFSLIDQVKSTEIHDDFDKYREKVQEAFGEYSKEELIDKFLSKEFNRFVEYYNDSRDINASLKDGGKGGRDRDRGRGRDRDRNGGKGKGGRRDRNRGESAGYKTLYVNVGREDRVNVGQLIDFVCTNADVRGRVLGRIRLQDKFSFVEVEDKDAAGVLKKLDKSSFEGKKLKVEYAKPRN